MWGVGVTSSEEQNTASNNNYTCKCANVRATVHVQVEELYRNATRTWQQHAHTCTQVHVVTFITTAGVVCTIVCTYNEPARVNNTTLQ